MSVAWTCQCGRSLEITPAAQLRRVGCPFCNAVILIPAAPARSGIGGWLLAAAVFLLIAVGIVSVTAVVLTGRPKPVEPQQTRTEPPPPEQPPTPPVKPVDDSRATGRLEAPTPTPEKKPEPKPPEKKQPRPPLIEIVKVEPAEPKAGERFSVETKLTHPDGDKVRLQYRLDPEAKWEDAPGSRVELAKVTGPLLVLELRGIDSRDQTSPVERRTWTVPTPPLKPSGSLTAVRLEWKLKKGDAFLQELTVSQRPTFNVAGVTVESPLRYSVLSRFTVTQASPDGYQVEQKIEKAQLLQADETTQAALRPAVARMPGTVYRIHLDSKMEVKKFEGGDARWQFGARDVGGVGIQAASLLDQDGWKEMAQATFFRPLEEVSPRTNWVRPMTHNWGPLGHWTGQTLYVYAGRQAHLHQFNYGHRMTHVPPKGNGGGALFQITGAGFTPLEAAGQLVFDANLNRVVAGQEKFRVRGRVGVALLGMQTPVDIEEEQHFQFRILAVAP